MVCGKHASVNRIGITSCMSKALFGRVWHCKTTSRKARSNSLAMMRHPTEEAVPAIIDLAKAIKLFDSDEEIEELVRKPLQAYLQKEQVLAHKKAGCFNMFFLAVSPELQNKRIGAQMVSKVQEWAKAEHGAVRLLVETACNMEGANAFYQKMGFVERKRMKDMCGEGVDEVQYAKELKVTG